MAKDQVELAATVTNIEDYPTATIILTVIADTVEDAERLLLRTLGGARDDTK